MVKEKKEKTEPIRKLLTQEKNPTKKTRPEKNNRPDQSPGQKKKTIGQQERRSLGSQECASEGELITQGNRGTRVKVQDTQNPEKEGGIPRSRKREQTWSYRQRGG